MGNLVYTMYNLGWIQQCYNFKLFSQFIVSHIFQLPFLSSECELLLDQTRPDMLLRKTKVKTEGEEKSILPQWPG